MGIIQRQGVKYSIVNLLGVAIGAVSVLFIYQLDKEIYGYAQFLYGTALFLVPFASLGVTSLVIKFFPFFKMQLNREKGYLSFIIILFVASFGIFSIIYLFLNDYLFDFLHEIGVDSNGRIRENIIYIFPLIFLIAFCSLLNSHAANYKRIVVPEIMNNLAFKFFLPGIVLLFYFGYLNRNQFAGSLTIFYSLLLIGLFIYLAKIDALDLGNPGFNFISRKMRKEFGQYAFFGGLNNISTMMAFRIDSIMISTMLGFGSNGLYFIMLFLANVIEIPYRALMRITAPVISEAWEKNDHGEIRTVYSKSSINLIIAGIPVFILIWFSLGALDNLSLNDQTFETGRYVFLFLAMSRLIDLAAGVNNQVLIYSGKYRYSLLFILILGIINVILNYHLIRIYGIEGAAMATLFSVLIYNLMKFGFIWFHFKIQPLSTKTVTVLLMGSAVYGFLYFMPKFSNPIIEIMKNGLVICVFYFPVLYLLKVSNDMNKMIGKYIQLIKKYL